MSFHYKEQNITLLVYVFIVTLIAFLNKTLKIVEILDSTFMFQLESS